MFRWHVRPDPLTASPGHGRCQIPKELTEQAADNTHSKSRGKKKKSFLSLKARFEVFQHLPGIVRNNVASVCQQTKVYGEMHLKAQSLATKSHCPLP